MRTHCHITVSRVSFIPVACSNEHLLKEYITSHANAYLEFNVTKCKNWRLKLRHASVDTCKLSWDNQQIYSTVQFEYTSQFASVETFSKRWLTIHLAGDSTFSQIEGVIDLHEIASGPNQLGLDLVDRVSSLTVGRVFVQCDIVELQGIQMDIKLHQLKFQQPFFPDPIQIQSSWKCFVPTSESSSSSMTCVASKEWHSIWSAQKEQEQEQKNAWSLLGTEKEQVQILNLDKLYDMNQLQYSQIVLSLHAYVPWAVFKTWLAQDKVLNPLCCWALNSKNKTLSLHDVQALSLSQQQNVFVELELGKAMFPLFVDYEGKGSNVVTSLAHVEEVFMIHPQWSWMFPKEQLCQVDLEIVNGPSYFQMQNGFYDGTKGVLSGSRCLGFAMVTKQENLLKDSCFNLASKADAWFHTHHPSNVLDTSIYTVPKLYWERHPVLPSNLILEEAKSLILLSPRSKSRPSQSISLSPALSMMLHRQEEHTTLSKIPFFVTQSLDQVIQGQGSSWLEAYQQQKQTLASIYASEYALWLNEQEQKQHIPKEYLAFALDSVQKQSLYRKIRSIEQVQHDVVSPKMVQLCNAQMVHR